MGLVKKEKKVKIIVDEMPTKTYECIFSEFYSCKLTGSGCSVFSGNCELLKPITDFHAEEIINKYNDGSYDVRTLDIK